MHSHDRTLLARLGFSDPDRKNPLHDKACRYLAQPDKARALVLDDCGVEVHRFEYGSIGNHALVMTARIKEQADIIAKKLMQRSSRTPPAEPIEPELSFEERYLRGGR